MDRVRARTSRASRSTGGRRGARRVRQLDLPLPHAKEPPVRGGKRKGAGRKPKGAKAGVRHAARPLHDRRHPVHVTMRVRPEVPNLRSQTILRLLVGRFQRAAAAGDFRVVHFSVQTNHLHLVVEASDGAALKRRMTGLSTWIARRLNALMKRSGKVWNDRYHRRDLKTPREVRNALVYVLQNRRKHVFQQQGRDIGGADSFSTAAWLIEGWHADATAALREARRGFLRALGPPPPGRQHEPIAEAKEWLTRLGWRRAKPGLLSIRELPATDG